MRKLGQRAIVNAEVFLAEVRVPAAGGSATRARASAG